MTVNPYRGEAALVIGGEAHTVFFGWGGIAALRSEFGENFDVAITQAIAAQDLETIAKVLAVGLRQSWPGVTSEAIMDASPPIAKSIEAVMLAWKRTFQGDEEVRDEPAENPRRKRRQATR